jgi:hypothetical protein
MDPHFGHVPELLRDVVAMRGVLLPSRLLWIVSGHFAIRYGEPFCCRNVKTTVFREGSNPMSIRGR